MVEPIVTMPVPVLEMPVAPTVSTRLVPPPCNNTLADDTKAMPPTDWLASRLTIWFVTTDVMLKVATSPEPGTAAGFVVELAALPQALKLFQLVPVPSQYIATASARWDPIRAIAPIERRHPSRADLRAGLLFLEVRSA